jgi:hypothetical protein
MGLKTSQLLPISLFLCRSMHLYTLYKRGLFLSTAGRVWSLSGQGSRVDRSLLPRSSCPAVLRKDLWGSGVRGKRPQCLVTVIVRFFRRSLTLDILSHPFSL